MVYTTKNLKIISIIFLMLFISLCFNFGCNFLVNSEYSYMFLIGAVLNLTFFKFNLIVRFFNVFVKTTVYFIKNKLPFKIKISYYIYNIICFVVLIPTVLAIENNIIDFNNTIGVHAQIYSYLLSVIFALMYLDHTYSDKIEYNKLELSNTGKILSIIFIFSIAYLYFIAITNIFNPILCESTSGDNPEINQESQTGNIPNNEQDNGNNNNVNDNNKDSENSVKQVEFVLGSNQQQSVSVEDVGNINSKVDGADIVKKNFEEFSEAIREIRNEEIFDLFKENSTSSFHEAFPNFAEAYPNLANTAATYAQVSKVMNDSLPEVFKDSAVFEELKKRYIEGSIYSSNLDENTKFLTEVFKLITDNKSGFNNINKVYGLLSSDGSASAKEEVVRLEGGKLIIDLNKASQHVYNIFKYIIEHKQDVALSTLGTGLTILFYYRSAVKLNARATEVLANELKLLKDADRLRFLQSRQRTLSYFNSVGGVLVAGALYGISAAISNHLSTQAKKQILAGSSSSLIGFIKKPKNFDWLKFLIICVSIILYNLLQFLGVKNLSDLFNVSVFLLIFNLIFIFFIAYCSITVLLIIDYPHGFESSKIFKYLPKFLKNYLIECNQIKDPILIKAYIKLYTGIIFMSTLFLTAINIVLLYFF
uniref:hypothetical protein n=1 Tax=Inonotus hispidus TaxID=40469 RepID=UPI00218237EB|nr:hypothetical protein N4M07_mgp049 [Inonotus hispidus]UVF38003.1 hypothetical protein [Inonotus hispidus]